MGSNVPFASRGLLWTDPRLGKNDDFITCNTLMKRGVWTKPGPRPMGHPMGHPMGYPQENKKIKNIHKKYQNKREK